MKKLIIVALLAVASFAVTAQVRVPYYQILMNVPTYSTGGGYPLVWNATTGIMQANKDSTNYFRTKSIIPTSGVQTAATANDTLTGKYLTIVTAARLDTLTLRRTLYTAGQVFEVVCTNASNDSTLVKSLLGNINGASTYWLTGTYKAMRIYYDGTNFWVLNKQ